MNKILMQKVCKESKKEISLKGRGGGWWRKRGLTVFTVQIIGLNWFQSIL